MSNLLDDLIKLTRDNLDSTDEGLRTFITGVFRGQSVVPSSQNTVKSRAFEFDDSYWNDLNVNEKTFRCSNPIPLDVNLNGQYSQQGAATALGGVYMYFHKKVSDRIKGDVSKLKSGDIHCVGETKAFGTRRSAYRAYFPSLKLVVTNKVRIAKEMVKIDAKPQNWYAVWIPLVGEDKDGRRKVESELARHFESILNDERGLV